jgi:hypothetical protein
MSIPDPRLLLPAWALAFVLFATFLVSGVQAQPQIENAFPQLSFSGVIDIQAPPDGTNRLFVVERAGRILAFENSADATEQTTFLDIRSRVDTEGEGGLLGMAFHPDYAQNGHVFVYYTVDSSPLRSVIARFTVSSDPDVASVASEQIVLEVEQPRSNHNAGQLQFGPDGYLYVGFGDGGGGGDPGENGQAPTNLLGSMLRLDVDLDGSGRPPDCGTGAYEVPADNPFIGDGNACDETYAYGLRNPFRYSFGPEGRLWVADVGQGSWEEIDWLEAGKNYGWNTMEGAHCYDPSSDCNQTGLELPVFEYGRGDGRSITGGYVSTGSCADLNGRYVYGDFTNGRIWALDYDDAGALGNELIYDSGLSLTTFGQGPNGELYFAGLYDSAVHRFICNTLPVELTEFRGQVSGRSVRLRWTTASESNNAGFVVQRQVGERFERLGFVDGAGTVQEPQTYTFTMDDLPPGTHRFRLKQIDRDGGSSYSPMVEVAVSVESAFDITAPHPNPFATQATFSLAVQEAQPVHVVLYDVMGRRVRTVFEDSVTPGAPATITVDAGGLASGRYLLRIEGRSFAVTRDLSLVR